MKTNLKRNVQDFLMGADPELLTMYKGQVAQFHGNAASDFGLDGNGRTVELRLPPSANPIELISSIHKIFKKQIKAFPVTFRYDWLAGSYRHNLSLGGHVHFGISKYKIEHAFANEVISNYVGALALALENKQEAVSRRQVAEYGGYNDFRKQPHGFEHRSFSSWLVSPAVAVSIVCLCKVVMFELLNNKSFSPNAFFCEDTFKYADTDTIKKKFPAIWKEIIQMSLYKKYQKEIDILHYLITNNLTWYPKNITLKEAWGIVDTTIPVESKNMDLNIIWKPFRI